MCSGQFLYCYNRKFKQENFTAIYTISFGKYENIFSVERSPNGSISNCVTESLPKLCRYAK